MREKKRDGSVPSAILRIFLTPRCSEISAASGTTKNCLLCSENILLYPFSSLRRRHRRRRRRRRRPRRRTCGPTGVDLVSCHGYTLSSSSVSSFHPSLLLRPLFLSPLSSTVSSRFLSSSSAPMLSRILPMFLPRVSS